MKKRVPIQLTEDEHTEVRRLAFAENISMSEYIMRAVRLKVKRDVKAGK